MSTQKNVSKNVVSSIDIKNDFAIVLQNKMTIENFHKKYQLQINDIVAKLRIETSRKIKMKLRRNLRNQFHFYGATKTRICDNERHDFEIAKLKNNIAKSKTTKTSTK